ncbi:MAG: Mn2+/Fe2+ NRAMP family transporter [Neolewinella sp.]
MSTFFASPAVKIHQIKKHVLFNSRSLATFLPGIFFLGFNIGTGSVTAMAKAGASYGMLLLWTIVASCLIIGVLPLTSSRD